MNHRHLYEGFGTLNGSFVVFGQAPRAIQPSESSFHDPALRLNNESFLAFRSGHDFQGPDPPDPRPSDDRPIRGIHPDDLGEFHLLTKLGECCFGAFGILYGRGCNHQCPDQAERINHDVPFATGDFFFLRRSLSARLVPWSSRSGCPERPLSAWAFCPRLGGRGSANDHECRPTFRPFARTGSNGTRCGRVADRGACHATRHHYASDKGSR
jgi:hypothetical protein